MIMLLPYLPLIIFLLSLFIVHKLTELILIPEHWLLGLKVCLPPQIESKESPPRKKRLSNSSDVYIRIEPIQEEVVPYLYYFKEFDRMISCLLILLINYGYNMLSVLVRDESFWISSLFSSAQTTSTTTTLTDISYKTNNTYTLVCCVVLIMLACYTISQSTLLGLKKTFKSTTLSNRDDFLFIMCLAMSILSFLLSFTIISADSPFLFSLYSASNDLRVGLRVFCKDNMWNRCVAFIDDDFKRYGGSGLLWFFMRLSCASASAILVFSIFMPIARTIRCHYHLNSSFMQSHYHQSGDDTKKSSSLKFQVYSWLNIILSAFVALCYYEPFLHFLHIYDRSKQYMLLFIVAVLSSFFRFYCVRCYVQSYLFYSMQFALDDASKEAKKYQKSAQKEYSPSFIRNSILKQKLLAYFKYVVLVAMQLAVLPCLQLAFTIIIHLLGGFSLTQYVATTFKTIGASPTSHNEGHWAYLILNVCGFLAFWSNVALLILGSFSYCWFRSVDKTKNKPE